MTGPVAWIRYRSDGGVEGPILDEVIEEVHRRSGVWTPLYAVPRPAPAIDLEQFRDSVEAEFELACADQLCELITYSRHEELKAKHDRLLALIDGQAGKHPDSVLLDSGVIRYPSRNEFGEQCHVIHRGLDLRACIAAGIEELQPTKGEGE